MKKTTIKTQIFIAFFFLGLSTFFAQDVAMNSNELELFETDYKTDPEDKEVIKETSLEEGKYAYTSKGKEVIVEIKDGFYTEYHGENEFIKAKINWSSENNYKLVVTEIQKENLPFKEGTVMETEIIKVKGDKFYYESNLEGLTWSGRFRKID